MIKPSRTIVLSGTLDKDLVDKISTALIQSAMESKKPITLYINSGGGFTDQTYKLCETIISLGVPVITVGFGTVASAANLVFATGGTRILLRHATLVHHMPGVSLPEIDEHYIFSKSDLLAYIDSIIAALAKIESSYRDILVMVTKRSKVTPAALARLIDKSPNNELLLTAEKALKLGLTDKVLPSFSAVSAYIKRISTKK